MGARIGDTGGGATSLSVQNITIIKCRTDFFKLQSRKKNILNWTSSELDSESEQNEIVDPVRDIQI